MTFWRELVDALRQIFQTLDRWTRWMGPVRDWLVAAYILLFLFSLAMLLA